MTSDNARRRSKPRRDQSCEHCLNGQKLLSYIDFGSIVVALREADARSLNLAWKNEDVEQLVGYGSRTVKPLAILTAHLSIGGVEARVDVHVVPDSAQTSF